MSIFRRKTAEEKQLESLLQELQMNMANNYKDNACACFRSLSETYLSMKAEGKLSARVMESYEALLAEYEKKLSGYSHNAQKPYWTKEDLLNH